MSQISLQIPQSGQAFSTEGPKVATDLTLIQTAINGNLDTTNLTAAVSQSAGVNAGGVVVKGAVNIATSESRTNVAYGTLTTPDQVTGIVLPSNGLIAVWYQATWQESAVGAARAAVFIGANQLVVQTNTGTRGPAAQAAATGASTNANVNTPLFTTTIGLASVFGSASYASDATTGQVVGYAGVPGFTTPTMDVGGTVSITTGATDGPFVSLGSPCWVFAAAGTYTVSVQFKASSGSVTASGRKLWVQAISFS